MNKIMGIVLISVGLLRGGLLLYAFFSLLSMLKMSGA